MKKCVLLFTAAALLAIVICGCGKKKVETGGNVPERIKEGLEAIPEDVLCGIGVAKTESDGEAILLAEDLARAEIARQLSLYIQDMTNKYDDGTPEKKFTMTKTDARLAGSRVILREKDKNGYWWCIVHLSKNQEIHEPETGNIDRFFDFLSSNAAELSDSDMASKKQDVVRGGEIFKVFQEETASIPDWVLNPNQPEDTAYGLGAAKLDNDEASIQLAKERARRSLARSLDAKVMDGVYDYGINDNTFFAEVYSSVTSVYDYTAFQAQLVKYTKTKDGTWWVLLQSQLPQYFDAEDAVLRLDEAFRKVEEQMK